MRVADELLAAILQTPADDTVRLVLADLLREQDDPADQALGRFLWGGVVASWFRTHHVIEDPNYYSASREIGRACAEGWPGKWMTSLGLAPWTSARRYWLWDSTHDQVTVRCGGVAGIFTRGMLSELQIPLKLWRHHAQGVLSRWPLERVRILELPGVLITVDKAGEQWRLAAALSIPRRRHRTLFAGPIPAAMMPQPMIVEDGGEWMADELFGNRTALVESAAVYSHYLVGRLIESADDLWPDNSG